MDRAGRYYNVWLIDDRRWTASLSGIGNREDYYQNYNDPERLSYDEAKSVQKHHADNWPAEIWIVLEMRKDGKPILPKCIIEKYGE